jgi:F0F1-type ATP synthase assembly protein I
MRGWTINSASKRTLTDQDTGLKMIMAQCLLTVIAAIILFPFGLVYAYSGALGGGIATISNALFARKVFGEFNAQNPGMMLARFIGAEVQKIIVIALLFASAIIWFDVLSYATLFGSYLFVQIGSLILFHLVSGIDFFK